MKRKIRKKEASDLLRAPAFPYSGPQLFQRLRAALVHKNGFQPSFSHLGRLIGQEKNLTYYWFNGMPQSQVIAFLALLERLPDPKRRDLINDLCRELPTLENPRLAHDPLTVSNLEQLLLQGRGLTWIRGGTEFERTFLSTALGHSFSWITGNQEIVAGLDIHEPRKWVPLERLVYFKHQFSSDKLKKLILEAWPAVRISKARLLLMNEVWAIAPELRPEIVEQANHRHIIITAPDVAMSYEKPSIIKTPIHTLRIAAQRENERLIRVKIEPLDSGSV